VVLDEIHRLPNPSELLKIAADHFPGLRILATGSSTPGVSTRFRDTLTGRERDIRLTPMTLADLADFGSGDLRHRLLRGGLPPFFLAPTLPERDFQEWMDAYWAKDIQELFRLERRAAFQPRWNSSWREAAGSSRRASSPGCARSAGPRSRAISGPSKRPRWRT
jgi:predicted AAA+ superfamily ATPase